MVDKKPVKHWRSEKMNKERLEEIKTAVNNYDETFQASLYGYALDEQVLIDDYKWLIEQAERVKELEEENAGLHDILVQIEYQEKDKLLGENKDRKSVV